MKKKTNPPLTPVLHEVARENKLMVEWLHWLDYHVPLILPTTVTMSVYFALEGIVGSGKTTVMQWLEEILNKNGYSYVIIPEPVEKFKKKLTYDPLEECYRDPEKSAALAQIHIMDESIKHYTAEIAKARSKSVDFIISERSICSPLIFTDAYFLDEKFSAFTKDSINMMWDQDMDGFDVNRVKPDCIVLLKVPVQKAKTRIRECRDTVRSESEIDSLGSSYSSFLENQEKACERFMENTDIPHQVVDLKKEKDVTPRDVAFRVFRILKDGICADRGSSADPLLRESDNSYEDEEDED